MSAAKPFEPVMTAAEVENFVMAVFPQSDIYRWFAKDVRPGEISVGMRISDQDLRPGGTISGPTMFALADVTAYLLILAHIGEVALAVTTSLTINFLNKPEPGDLVAHGRLIKLGKRLAVCEVHIEPESGGPMVAQATATYSIPPRG
ncbi:MAG: PaaI family thioesterase [Nitratireductor sp.]|nr:PaaI family thioesterase [Nitratireductor sp.]